MITFKVTLYTPVMLIIERRKNIHIFHLVFLLETTTTKICVCIFFFLLSIDPLGICCRARHIIFFLFLAVVSFLVISFHFLFHIIFHSFSLSSWLILIDWQGLTRSVLPLRSREFSPVTEDFDLDGGPNWSWHVVGGKEKNHRQKRKKRSTNF